MRNEESVINIRYTPVFKFICNQHLRSELNFLLPFHHLIHKLKFHIVPACIKAVPLHLKLVKTAFICTGRKLLTSNFQFNLRIRYGAYKKHFDEGDKILPG